MWKCYELKYETKSPLHIGYGSQLGIVNRTRYYIPGKTMWGAVTAVLSRRIMQSYDKEIYKKLGEFVTKHLIFSYFYPAKGADIFYPNYTGEGLKFGDKEKGMMSKEEFERKFITSYVSTAIERGKGAAEEASLHEIELISPVQIVGYLFTDLEKDQGYAGTNVHVIEVGADKIWIKIEDKGIEIFDAINDIQVGGERIYGFGKLKLIDNEIKQKDKFFDKYELVLSTKKAGVTTEGEIIALSPVLIEDIKRLNSIKGDMEPLVVREWGSKGAGRDVNYHGVALVPGTRFKTDCQIAIDEFCLWKLE